MTNHSNTCADTVLITGSSRGIGRAIALKAASQGFDVVIHCVNDIQGAQQTAQLAKEHGVSTRVLQFDLNHREQVLNTLEADITSHGAYYGVVCNAGISRDAAFPMLSDDDWDEVLSTNLDGFYNVVKPLVMPMIRRRKPGRIITMSSVSGLAGNRGQVNYSAAKAGIIGATKALAIELAKRKITVNCVAPGLIDTDMTEHLAQEEMIKMIPAQRAGTPEEVAGVVGFLLSSESAYVTRQVIAVNGGML